MGSEMCIRDRVGLMPQTGSEEARIYLEKQAQTAKKIAEGLKKSNTKRNESKKYYELAREIEDICIHWKEKR